MEQRCKVDDILCNLCRVVVSCAIVDNIGQISQQLDDLLFLSTFKQLCAAVVKRLDRYALLCKLFNYRSDTCMGILYVVNRILT